MLKHRLLIGPLLILGLIGLLWLDEHLDRSPVPAWAQSLVPEGYQTWPPNMVLLPVALLVVVLAARELAAMFKAGGVQASRRWLGFAAAIGLIVCALVPVNGSPVDAAALVGSAGAAVLVVSMLWHIRGRTLQGATAAAGAATFAFIYLGLMLGFLVALRRDQSTWTILGVLLIVKSCDIGAYFTGRLFGRHKLIPWLSPGKTWEGLLGGALTSAAVAVGVTLVARDIHPPPPGRPIGFEDLGLWHAALFGAAMAVIGQAGDLLESVLKRDAGIKDSGATVPGFGGVLDVLDSILLAAPVAYWVLTRV